MAVEYFQGQDDAGNVIPDDHRFRVKAANGEILSSSEAYVSASNAKRGYRALLDAVHADVLAELRAGTIVESEESRAAAKNDAAEAFLNMLADAHRFDEDIDGPNTSDVNYHLTVGHVQLEELANALGINRDTGYMSVETIGDAIKRQISAEQPDRGPQAGDEVKV